MSTNSDALPIEPIYLNEAQDKQLTEYHSYVECTKCKGTLRVRITERYYACPCNISYDDEVLTKQDQVDDPDKTDNNSDSGTDRAQAS